MPVVDDRAMRAQYSGTYGCVRDYWEKDFARWEANVSRSHHAGAPYPPQRILDDLRAGRTVNVPTYSLPRSVLSGAPTRPGPTVQYGPLRGSPGVIYPQRAIVRPDDVITFNDENCAQLWLEENDI
jgi:hypothetical protein